MANPQNYGLYIPIQGSFGMINYKKIKSYNLKELMKLVVCKQCGKDFETRYYKFCGYDCYHKSLKGVSVGIFWETATEQQKIDRLAFYFNKNVIKQEGCWNWKRATSRGYGKVSINSSKNNKYIQSHRVSWMIHKGPIPEGLLVLHKCDNRICTNPDHLFLGTTKDNAVDRKNKGRGHPQFGEKNHCAKLTEKNVREVRALIASSIPYSQISTLYGIKPAAISSIKHRRTWRHCV